jgi:hypothetical protein
VVDFEDSGRSDRAFELAYLTEHIGMWLEAGNDADDVLGRFDLTAADSARLPVFRRGSRSSGCLVHDWPGPVSGQHDQPPRYRA